MLKIKFMIYLTRENILGGKIKKTITIKYKLLPKIYI